MSERRDGRDKASRPRPIQRRSIRYERCSEHFYALAMLACSVICFNALQQPPW